jgi:hypothetical protein
VHADRFPVLFSETQATQEHFEVIWPKEFDFDMVVARAPHDYDYANCSRDFSHGATMTMNLTIEFHTDMTIVTSDYAITILVSLVDRSYGF